MKGKMIYFGLKLQRLQSMATWLHHCEAMVEQNCLPCGDPEAEARDKIPFKAQPSVALFSSPGLCSYLPNAITSWIHYWVCLLEQCPHDPIPWCLDASAGDSWGNAVFVDCTELSEMQLKIRQESVRKPREEELAREKSSSWELHPELRALFSWWGAGAMLSVWRFRVSVNARIQERASGCRHGSQTTMTKFQCRSGGKHVWKVVEMRAKAFWKLFLVLKM